MTRLLRALTLLALLPASLPAQSDDAGRLVAALLGDTPMTSDLETVTDRCEDVANIIEGIIVENA